MSEFLNNLKEGDTVVVDHSFGRVRLATVDRLTKTQFIVGSYRYSRKDGYRIGQHYGRRDFLREPTPTVVEKINRDRAIDKLRHTDFANIPTENLMKAVEALGI